MGGYGTAGHTEQGPRGHRRHRGHEGHGPQCGLGTREGGFPAAPTRPHPRGEFAQLGKSLRGGRGRCPPGRGRDRGVARTRVGVVSVPFECDWRSGRGGGRGAGRWSRPAGTRRCPAQRRRERPVRLLRSPRPGTPAPPRHSPGTPRTLLPPPSRHHRPPAAPGPGTGSSRSAKFGQR